jgi:hypothetical protein
VRLGGAAGSLAVGGLLQVREGALGEVVLDVVEQPLPAAHPRSTGGGVTQARRADVGGSLAGLLNGEGGIGHAQKARTDSLGRAADADEARQRQVLGRQLHRHHRAHGRELNHRAGLPAGVHEGRAALVAALVGDEVADDRQMLHLLGGFGQDLADLDARGRGLDGLELARGRLIDLDVPQVHVAGTAAHPHDDEALVLLLHLRRLGLNRLEEVEARDSQGRGPRDVRHEMPAIDHLDNLPDGSFPWIFPCPPSCREEMAGSNLFSLTGNVNPVKKFRTVGLACVFAGFDDPRCRRVPRKAKKKWVNAKRSVWATRSASRCG